MICPTSVDEQRLRDAKCPGFAIDVYVDAEHRKRKVRGMAGRVRPVIGSDDFERSVGTHDATPTRRLPHRRPIFSRDLLEKKLCRDLGRTADDVRHAARSRSRILRRHACRAAPNAHRVRRDPERCSRDAPHDRIRAGPLVRHPDHHVDAAVSRQPHLYGGLARSQMPHHETDAAAMPRRERPQLAFEPLEHQLRVRTLDLLVRGKRIARLDAIAQPELQRIDAERLAQSVRCAAPKRRRAAARRGHGRARSAASSYRRP